MGEKIYHFTGHAHGSCELALRINGSGMISNKFSAWWKVVISLSLSLGKHSPHFPNLDAHCWYFCISAFFSVFSVVARLCALLFTEHTALC